MNRLSIKIAFILSLLFLLDLIKPLGFALSVEFILLGLIFISLNCRLWITLTFAVIFGHLKDCLIFESRYLNLIEFPFLCFILSYLSTHLFFSVKKRYTFIVQGGMLLGALVLHSILNSVYLQSFFPLFSLKFIIQSFFTYILLNYLIVKRYKFLPAKIT